MKLIDLQIMLDIEVLSEGSIRSAAKKIGISASHLSRIQSGNVRPGPKVLNYMGLKEERIYVDNTEEV